MAKAHKKNVSSSPDKEPRDRRPAPGAISKNRVHPYSQPHPDRTAADGEGWTIREICKAYNWPEPKDAAGGGTIAVIHLAGRWLDEDVARFFEYQGIPEEHQPDVSDNSQEDNPAGGPSNPPTDADVEVALDIQIAGASYALATNQPATIKVYKGAQTAEGLIAALRAAATDECDVCCITWGKDEQSWNAADVAAFQGAAKAAIENGMIIVAASGDNDSSDGGPTPANVDFPASSPYVVSCGGTSRVKAPKPGQPVETVWNNNPGHTNGQGTGGGFSELFPIADWQLGTVQARMRMVPDIAAHADPETGYRIFVGGEPRIVGGTSAAAALYAGLFASFGPKRGFVTPDLYKNPICFNDIRGGDNGMFRAMVGPDPCTGIGSPRADLLAKRIGSDRATLARVRRQLLDTVKADAPCTCQPTPFSGAPPRVASAPYHCVLSANGTWWKFPYDPITGLPTGPGVPAGPGECSASPALTPRVASAPYHCVLSANGTWWKFPYDPISGLRTGPGAPAGPGECS